MKHTDPYKLVRNVITLPPFRSSSKRSRTHHTTVKVILTILTLWPWKATETNALVGVQLWAAAPAVEAGFLRTRVALEHGHATGTQSVLLSEDGCAHQNDLEAGEHGLKSPPWFIWSHLVYKKRLLLRLLVALEELFCRTLLYQGLTVRACHTTVNVFDFDPPLWTRHYAVRHAFTKKCITKPSENFFL